MGNLDILYWLGTGERVEQKKFFCLFVQLYWGVKNLHAAAILPVQKFYSQYFRSPPLSISCQLYLLYVDAINIF